MASQRPTISSTTSNNELRRKIRDSCNNCGAQKIRCGKQRPSCSRCVQKSLPCSYSYSQRAGRRSSMATQRDGAHVASLPTVPGSPASITDANAMYMPTAPLTTTTSACQAPVLTASMENPLDYDQSPFDDADPFANLTFDFLTTSPHPGTMTSLSGVSNATATSGTTDAAHFIESEAFWQSLPSIPERNHDVLKSVSSHPIFDQDQVAAFRRSMEETTPRRHDCMQLALKVVSDLSVPREPCTVASSNSMAGIDGPNTEARDVDTVLFMNRDAAQSIKSILDCTCSTDQAVLLACYLATSKVVDWYSAAMEAVGEHLASTDQPTKGFSYKSSADNMAERIVTRPIYMGKYCLDSEVQRVIRAQVVLGELKEHVQPLLNSLPRFHVNSRDSEKESAAHIAQACALRSQLRIVVQKARNLNSTGSN